MPSDDRDVLETLKFELEFVQQGGYGRSVRTPWQATSIFQDSPACPNFNNSAPPTPCNECLLIDFVPKGEQAHDVPCHQIAIGPQGETVEMLEQQQNQAALEEALKNWLQVTVDKLEDARALKAQS